MYRSMCRFNVNAFAIVIQLLCFLNDDVVALFFPAASVLQVTSSLSVPILIKDRKMFWDWGLQMNYNFPAQPSSFYAASIWPGEFARHRRELFLNATARYTPPSGNELLYPSDFTAGQLYLSLEHTLEQYGFDASCLLRSVCELARHPFSDERKNILTELLTFVLTPSLHDAFGSTETLYRELYEHAEHSGFIGENCSLLYKECHLDVISAITKLVA